MKLFFFFYSTDLFFFQCIYFIFGCTESSLLCQDFLQLGQAGLLFLVVHRLLIAVTALVVEHRLQGVWASVGVVHRLSCSVPRGVLPNQGLNSCSLHWQADSQPLAHQGSPILLTFFFRTNLIIQLVFLLFFFLILKVLYNERPTVGGYSLNHKDFSLSDSTIYNIGSVTVELIDFQQVYYLYQSLI